MATANLRSIRLDPAGAPIPTYDQRTIGEMAKVFTGWAFASTSASPSFTGAAANYVRPMMLYPSFHDDSAKTVVPTETQIVPTTGQTYTNIRATGPSLTAPPPTGYTLVPAVKLTAAVVGPGAAWIVP